MWDLQVDDCAEDSYKPLFANYNDYASRLPADVWVSDEATALRLLTQAVGPTDDCTPLSQLKLTVSSRGTCKDTRWTMTAKDRCSNAR